MTSEPIPLPQPAVVISGLTKIYRAGFSRKGVLAVNKVSFNVKAGEIYGLIGPNGSGKSTTMKCLLGLATPSEGTAEIFGKDSRQVDSRNDVGFLPENPYFYKYLTGRETLAFYGRLCGLSGKKLDERAKELLALVGLEQAATRRLSGYSKGMLQRIGLAQAIVHWPRLVVLDEPTAGVDPIGSRIIRDLIRELKQRGITVILSSHLLEQVQEVCDRVGIIFRGNLVREGPLEELMAIEDQTEILLRKASPELVAQLRALIAQHGETELLRAGNPRTTLERLFLEATGNADINQRETSGVGV